MNWTEEQKLYIQRNHKKLSVRQIAKEIGCSRTELEKYLASSSGRPDRNSTSFLSTVPASLLILSLFILTFATYANSIGYDFVWDDKIQILQNSSVLTGGLSSLPKMFISLVGNVEGSAPVSNSYRPISTLAFWINAHITGLNPASFHFVNVLLQSLAAVLLFITLKNLLGKTVSFWVSALFAVHPAQIAAVTYVSGRTEILAFIFMISCFFFHRLALQYHQRRFLYLFLSTLTFLCALLSKELSVAIIVLIFFHDKIFFDKAEKKWRLYASYILVALFYAGLRFKLLGNLGQGGVGELPFSERIPAAFLSFAHYLRILFFPTDLHMAHQFPRSDVSFSNPIVILGVVLVGALIAIAWFYKKSKETLFGWFWFWIFLMPVLNLFVLLNSPIAEHWLYNASIGFFIALILLLERFIVSRRWSKKIMEAVLAVCCLALAVTTHVSGRVWKDEVSLFENTVKYVHFDPMIYSNLGAAYAKKKNFSKAKENFIKALNIDPNFENAQYNLSLLEREINPS